MESLMYFLNRNVIKAPKKSLSNINLRNITTNTDRDIRVEPNIMNEPRFFRKPLD
jgi:hypothetical protein